jgi:hypothetical protein
MRNRDPPVAFLVQADLYDEERDGDWAELRQANLDEGSTDFYVAAVALGQILIEKEEEGRLLAEILQRCAVSLERNVEE